MSGVNSKDVKLCGTGVEIGKKDSKRLIASYFTFFQFSAIFLPNLFIFVFYPFSWEK